MYYNNFSRLKKALAPQTRAALHIALDRPDYYLGDAIGKREYISGDMPDTSILYKLHLECGRLVNLHDLFIAFKMVVEEVENVEESIAL